MNKKQVLVATAGIGLALVIYYTMFVLPLAQLKRQHPEYFVSISGHPSYVFASATAIVPLLAVLVGTVVMTVRLRNKG